MLLLFFFFKQKTAYEMRISDWSSDVCSSDLRAAFHAQVREALAEHLPEDRIDPPVVDMFLDRIDYCAVDAGKGAGYDDLAALLGDRMARPIGVYLSTPPSMFGPIAQGLAAENIRSDERRVGEEGVRTCRSRLYTYH